ncbi:MAG TPA: hypothetical protein VK500_02120, partial [Nitrospiraceae bacterium]|nr:hypothetical protein [Nitrospiraceae bacterium]
GQDSYGEIDPNLSRSYNWSNAGKLVVPNPRPGTPEWRKQFRRGLAEMLATVALRTLWRLPDRRNSNG